MQSNYNHFKSTSRYVLEKLLIDLQKARGQSLFIVREYYMQNWCSFMLVWRPVSRLSLYFPRIRQWQITSRKPTLFWFSNIHDLIPKETTCKLIEWLNGRTFLAKLWMVLHSVLLRREKHIYIYISKTLKPNCETQRSRSTSLEMKLFILRANYNFFFLAFCNSQELEGSKTNNGIHYRLQLLYANGMHIDLLCVLVFLELLLPKYSTFPSPISPHAGKVKCNGINFTSWQFSQTIYQRWLYQLKLAANNHPLICTNHRFVAPKKCAAFITLGFDWGMRVSKLSTLFVFFTCSQACRTCLTSCHLNLNIFYFLATKKGNSCQFVCSNQLNIQNTRAGPDIYDICSLSARCWSWFHPIT